MGYFAGDINISPNIVHEFGSVVGIFFVRHIDELFFCCERVLNFGNEPCDLVYLLQHCLM